MRAHLIALLILTAGAQTLLAQPSPHVAATDPLAPEKQRAVMKLPPGFEIQLVAAEPEIINPINIAFDGRGRLWVTQSIEYPFPAADPSKTRDTVKILEDFGPDGRARKITTFADNVNIPIGVLPVADGAIVFSIPNIYHMIDRDGDDRADERKVLYSSYGYKDTHGMTGEFMWGFDGWIYACHGFSNTSTVNGGGPTQITMQSGNTYRIKPDGSRIEYFTHGQVNPFGLAFDPLGNLYSCDCHTRPLYQLLRGGWYPSFGKPHDGLGFAPEMITHSHGSTAIAGIAYYADDRFPAEFRDNVFIGNVVTNRINRDRLERNGSTYKGIEMPDLVRGEDPWFRPVDIKLGPDGALYVADFYDRIIGHYEVPLTHPGRDRSHGRIWRIVYKGEPRPVTDLARANLAELAESLNHPNITVRIHATNQLVQRGGDAKAVLESLCTSKAAVQRAHALWGLARVGAASERHLQDAAQDTDALVRVHAMRVLAEREPWTAAERALAVAGLKDSDAFVQRAAADALGQHPQPENLPPLLELRRRIPASDTHLLHVVRMALRDQLANSAIADITSVKWNEADSRALADVAVGVPSRDGAAVLLSHLERFPNGNRLDAIGHHVGRHGDAAKLLTFARSQYADNLPAQATLLRAAQKGLQERGDKLAAVHHEFATDLTRRLLQSKSAGDVQLGLEIAGELKVAAVQNELRTLAADRSAGDKQRKAACTALAQLDPAGNVATLSSVLLAPAEAVEMREHVARALAQTNNAVAHGQLTKALEVAPGRLQTVIAVALAESKMGAPLLLEAIARGKASARLLQDRDVETRLQRSGIQDVQKKIASLTRGLPAADTALQQLIARRQSGAATANADVKKGLLVFEKNCAACHQIQNKGNKIGPQLDGVGIRGVERLLEDVLDPNRNVDQEFRATTLALANGQLVVGLFLRQEGEILVLADQQGKEVRVPANMVETRLVSQLSPMPASVAQQLPDEDFYHLLRYLLSQRPKDN